MSDQPQYDYIIAGAGAAGLSLLVRMIRSGKFTHKKILIVDREQKNRNDRTWCFWEREEDLFEEIVYCKWDQIWYHGPGFSKLFDIAPYRYKMIRGIDFYQYCFSIIAGAGNVTVAYGSITDMHSHAGSTWLLLDGCKITARYIFSSIVSPPVIKAKELYLQQHFKGWIIQTQQPLFDPQQATLMDFRVQQQHGTAFVYAMPFAPDRALVEYTLFTANLLQQHQYDEGLKDYIENYLHCSSYSVQEEEFGVIPMTNRQFPVRQSDIIYLGTAGGQTKASSGYTFRFIQKHTAALVDALLTNPGKLTLPHTSRRYPFYDSVLLNVLATGKASGASIFTTLFTRNPPHRIFRFLDNESSPADDLKVIASLPTRPFLKAAIEQQL